MQDEIRLGEILRDIEDYDTTASTLMQEIATFQEPLVIGLAHYFQIFANGYAFWQKSYDYSRIHEYFWVAFMVAEREINGKIGKITQEETAIEMLRNISLALIENTLCENSLVCNMPGWLRESSERAIQYMTNAINALNRLEIDESLRASIRSYLDINLQLYMGLQACAKLYITPWLPPQPADELSAAEAAAKVQMDQLNTHSRELFSELRAHLSFARHSANSYVESGYTTLRIRHAMILLRAMCYVGSELAEALFDAFREDRGPARLLDLANQTTQLGFEQVRSGYINETFETNMGIELLAPMVFTLPAGERGGVIFWLLDGNTPRRYKLEFFRITITRFGALSIDFRMCVGDCDEENEAGVSISHVRALEALMGPHIGNMEFEWRAAPGESTEGNLHFIRPEATNFVRSFNDCMAWIEKAGSLLPDEQYEYFRTHILPDEDINPDNPVIRWSKSFFDLNDRLRDPTRRNPYEPIQDYFVTRYEYVPDLKALQDHYSAVRQVFLNWEWLQSDDPADTPELKALKQEAQRIFPPGRVFMRLMDIAEEIQIRFQQFIEKLASDRGITVNKDIRSAFYFNRHYGWQSILEVNRIAIRDANGVEREPITAEDYEQLFSHPDFHGFMVTSREARAGLDDWRLASAPPLMENLAPIRSHKYDRFYAEQNRAFIFLPDDPDFIVNQYNDTARWAGNLATVLLAHQMAGKSLVKEIEAVLAALEKGEDRVSELPFLRGKIQIFRRESDKVTEMVRGFAMTKYVDHSELLRALVRTSRVEFLAQILEENNTALDRLYNYMGDLLNGSTVYHANKS